MATPRAFENLDRRMRREAKHTSTALYALADAMKAAGEGDADKWQNAIGRVELCFKNLENNVTLGIAEGLKQATLAEMINAEDDSNGRGAAWVKILDVIKGAVQA